MTKYHIPQWAENQSEMMSLHIWLFCLFLTSSVTLSLNPLEQEGPEVGCLDHSDCTQLGHKYGCLIYRCVDHSQVQSCESDLDCPAESDCQLTRLPGYPSGLCVPQSSLLPFLLPHARTAHRLCS